MKFATWNVKSLYAAGEIHNAPVDIAGNDMDWKDNHKEWNDILPNESARRYGVALVVTRDLNKWSELSSLLI